MLNDLRARINLYIVISLFSGFFLWILEASERYFTLQSNFVQKNEPFKFLLYFSITSICTPALGILLAIGSSIRSFCLQKVQQNKLFNITHNVRKKFILEEITTVLIITVALIFISLIFPKYFGNPIYKMASGATEKIKIFRILFGHKKVALPVLMFGISIIFCIFDEMVNWIARNKYTSSSNINIFKFGLAIATLFTLLGSYYADANIMVTRRDISFHLPMFLAATTSACLLAAFLYKIVTKTILGKTLLILIITLTSLSVFYTIKVFDSNQNLKSLFWRRGVVAKRYVGFLRNILNNDQNDFLSLLNKTSVNSKEKLIPSTYQLTSNQSTEKLLFVDTSIKSPRNVIFLSIDTLRADHMSCYGYKRTTTQNLDKFAEQSIFCKSSYSTGTNTGHSFSSIFRSALGDGIFDSRIPTITKIFADNGYQTACITSPPTKEWLFPERWLKYTEIMLDGFQEVVHKTPETWNAQEMTDHSIELVDKLRNKGQFFAWIHYTDPHSPYEQHSEYKFGNTNIDIYDSEIAYTDLHIKRLLEYLNNSGLMKNTMIVFTSDHGEGFGEHGEVEHGCLPYIEQNFVPIWIYTPEVTNQIIYTPISHLDLAPTMLNFAGIAQPKEYEGIDIVKLAKGLIPAQQVAITETPRNIPEPTFLAWALTENDWKIIYDKIGNNWQLYNLEDDPTEQHNLVDLESKIFDDLKQKVSIYLNQQAIRPNYSQWKQIFN